MPMRFLAVALLFLAGPALAESPPVLSQHVFISQIWEHKVVMSAPYDFENEEGGLENLNQWADWMCRLYGRRAVGPLNFREADSQACGLIQLRAHANPSSPMARAPTQAEKDACQVFHLYACAIR